MVNEDHLYCLRFHYLYAHFINTLELTVPGTGDIKVWAPLLSISNALSITGVLGQHLREGRGGNREDEGGWGVRVRSMEQLNLGWA